MGLRSLVVAFVAVAAAVDAASIRSFKSHAVKESVNAPLDWIKGEPAPAEHIINLRIGLPQPNFSELERQLYEVSDPDHARYGEHLSKEEVDALVAPHPESLNIVDQWLASHGLGEEHFGRSDARDWVLISLPVSQIEEMLDTRYHVYTHRLTGESIVRTTSYSLPQDLHDHVDVIQPTTIFSRTRRQSSTIHFEEESVDPSTLAKGQILASPDQNVDASCNTTITIKCLQQLYNTVGYKPKAAGKNQIGITGYLEEFANIQDLHSFYKDQLPQAINTSFKFVSVKGGQNSQNLSEAGGEANLDVQFAFGLSFPTPGTFWSTAGRPPFKPDLGTPNNTNEPYQDWLDFVLKNKTLPQTISTSYGDSEQTVPPAYARRVCNGFAQLGARGVSLMFSSGDGGVGDGNSTVNEACFSNDGKNTTKFLPLFPAGCPFVTAVGGTNNVPEIAVFFSGGGFSNYFSQPAYQASTVNAFLKDLGNTYKGLFNPKGRAYPDVAAEGRRFRVFVSGQPVSIGGTSASSPTFAAIVSLLNDARIAAGKKPLGFLNPWIYSKGKNGLNDITVGNNPGCGTPGFNATKGWDPITGFGTPNFKKLLTLLP